MSASELTTRAEAARAAVSAQTGLLHREFGRAESRWKGDGTRVTAVDIAISEAIVRDLSARFPGDQFFSEELAGAPGPIPATSRFCWVLDPIDGTNNFALGIPHCAISLGLFEAGYPVYGAIYDYSRRTLIHGGPGFGVHDGDRLVVPNRREPHKDSIIGLHSPVDKRLLPLANAVMANFKIRGLGSATLHLAYVATGLFDGAVDYNVKIWDLAAALPMCRAAGVEVEFLNGGQVPLRSFDVGMKPIIYVAGNPAMHARLKAITAPGL
jgi:myo-inositol-1(or 4)-monophosphatase